MIGAGVLSLLCVATPASPEGAVRAFYAEIVKRHPLGIPEGADQRALWPHLSARLVEALDTLRACEADYFAQNRRKYTREEAAQLKPEIGWLEYGLFSGGVERALPAQVEVQRVTPDGDRRFRVDVRFTYRDTFETYGRPPDDSNTFQWTAVVIVVREDGRYAIDDFMAVDERSGRPLPGLARLFPECDGPHHVGDAGEERGRSPGRLREVRALIEAQGAEQALAALAGDEPRFAELLDAIATGAPEWLDVAAVLRPAAGGRAAGHVSRAVHAALIERPENVLELVQRGAWEVRDACGTHGFAATEVQALIVDAIKWREERVAGVTRTDLVRTRDECLAELRALRASVERPAGR